MTPDNPRRLIQDTEPRSPYLEREIAGFTGRVEEMFGGYTPYSHPGEYQLGPVGKVIILDPRIQMRPISHELVRTIHEGRVVANGITLADWKIDLDSNGKVLFQWREVFGRDTDHENDDIFVGRDIRARLIENEGGVRLDINVSGYDIEDPVKRLEILRELGVKI